MFTSRKKKGSVGFFIFLSLILYLFLFRKPLSFGSGYAHMRKGPYLMLDGKPGDMIVLWQTDRTPGLSEIQWGFSPGNYDRSSWYLVEHGDHQFSYTITGLPPYTMVYYLVRVDKTEFVGRFRSGADLSDSRLTFYGYGDLRGDMNLLSDTHYMIHGSVERLMMVDLNQNPAVRQTFVVSLGDFVNCGLLEQYWDAQYFNRNLFYSLDFQANLPVMGTVGNHEGYLPGFEGAANMDCEPGKPGETPDCWITDTANAGKLYYKYFPYTLYPYPKGPGQYKDYYYYFDYGPARVISLDTFFSSWRVNSPQYLWASRTISSSRPWNIICTHDNLWSPKSDEDLRADLCPLFEAKGIPLVLQAHLHYYSRCLVNGITYLTLGSAGASLDDAFPYEPDNAPYVIKAAMTYSFARFEISGKTMTVTVFNINNQILDSFKILPAAVNISPAGGSLAPDPPTLTASPFSSQDGAKHQSSQWIIRNYATGQIIYITNSNGVPTFSQSNLTSFTVPAGVLQPAYRYTWQVIYKDSNGNTTQPSSRTDFIIRETFILGPTKMHQ